MEPYQALFAQADLSQPAPSLSGDLQPRLFYALEQLLCTPAVSSFMLVKAPEEPEYLQWLTAETRTLHEPTAPLYGVRYDVDGARVTLSPAQRAEDNFASTAPVVAADWVEAEQLFGCVRQFNGDITLQPGLVHQANGGVLVISLRTLLAQPLLWVRLKNMVTRQRFDWLSIDESRPLPVSIPSMPLSLKVMLVGERESLADFQEMEPELCAQAIYSEYEDTLQFADAETLKAWCQWVWQNALQLTLPGPAADAWPLLIDEGTRYTGDQETLPLSPLWIARQLREAAAFCEGEEITGEEMQTMLARREWREGYLAERMQDEILQEQILIETEGECVGQINALSVIEFPAIRAHSVNLRASAASCTLVMASLLMSNAKPSSAAIFMRKA